MQSERLSRDEFLMMFKEDVIRLSKYIPWLEEKSGADVSKNYEDGDKLSHTLSFPVYDSILLAFLNDASTTIFMEKNYQYFYTRNHVQDYLDELELIQKADIMHMDILQCILSRYVFGGMVKAYLWKDGVDHQIFINILKKAKQIVEFWSEPLIIEDEIPPEGFPEEIPFEYPEVDEADWTDEEFAAVLAGALDPNDIPRLHYEREHGITGGAAAGVSASAAAEPTETTEIEYPEVDEDDWTDEEFAAVLAGELDPSDIARLRYEKEHGTAEVAPAAEEPIAEPAAEPELTTEAAEAAEAPVEEKPAPKKRTRKKPAAKTENTESAETAETGKTTKAAKSAKSAGTKKTTKTAGKKTTKKSAAKDSVTEEENADHTDTKAGTEQN